MKVVVTGGAGFIGSAVIRHIIHETSWQVVNLDKLTYAGNLDSVASVSGDKRYILARLDILDEAGVRALFEREKPDAVMHLAAETHVDRSIDAPGVFVDTNITGTFRLLEAARDYWRNQSGKKKECFRFHHISTDEVYGSSGETGSFNEDSRYRPGSPYSASKAASDHLVRAWHHTYGLPVLITNCSNNYGPYQFPEKLIPLIIVRAIKGMTLPVYDKGANVRDWLHVEDHARALLAVLARGKAGETYNIGGNAERSNIDVVKTICNLINELRPRAEPYERLITFVADRMGHDLRYAIDAGKIYGELGWQPQESFESGLRSTVRWYLENESWTDRMLSGDYRTKRLGLENTRGMT